ncbi:MAG: CPBP family intramembrane glutamic endopeptidase [Longimicrobiales bacterium]
MQMPETRRRSEMPDPGALDHIVMALLVVVNPLYGAWEYRRLVRRIRAGEANARGAEYRKTMLLSWTFTIGLVALWLGADRPAAVLGFALPGGVRLLAGAIITILGLAFLSAQWRALSSMDEKGLEPLRAQMAAVADLMPRTEREAAQFRLVSVSAGVCEEIVYRGYMIWYLAAFMGEWPAVILGALIFGLGHLYQGTDGVIKTGVTGLMMGILYVATGSLLWPVILHTAVDLHGGGDGPARPDVRPGALAWRPQRTTV